MMKRVLQIYGPVFFIVCCLVNTVQGQNYAEIRDKFESPDYAQWGEVPLWWWEADSLSKDRVTWQLEKLAEKGVKAVCPIQRSPARTYPESFSEEWWEMMEYVHEEAKRLGMELWIYDQVGYGQYGWLEKAAAQVEDTGTSRVEFMTKEAGENEETSLSLPPGKVLGARAFPIIDDTARDENSINLIDQVKDSVLVWQPKKGKWEVAVSVAVPYRSFYLNEHSTDIFIDQLYDRIEDVVGEKAMGKSLAGVFQDEHPPIPRNIYSKDLAETFEEKFGYPIERAIPALHFDIGKKTPKYRINFFDAYLSAIEQNYLEKVYNWTNNRNILTSHDNWGRNNIYQQSEGYIDYFRTQRWFSAPGLDDYRDVPLEQRNYYDTKIASSIARLYDRPRVWAEAFHSSGWGRTTNQTLSWLSTLYAFGANLYDEHGLYYSLNASTWEHAAPDPHFRQPYWEYYQEISDWVARTSYIMSQGESVADVAVHYPVVSLLADPEEGDIDYNHYMELSRIVYNHGMDNDIIDDQSILEATIKEGRLQIGKNEYQALVFGPEITVRLPVLNKALQMAEDGGTVLFYGKLPTASVENGRKDEETEAVLKEFLGVSMSEVDGQNEVVEKHFDSGGYAAFRQHTSALLPSMLSTRINRDFISEGNKGYVSHRKIGDMDIYLIQNPEDKPIDLGARFRTNGVPEIWDPFTGEVTGINRYKRDGEYTHARIRLDGNVAKLIVFKPGNNNKEKTNENPIENWTSKEISDDWEFSIIPTRDNQWGDFRWPPSEELIGPEVRQFKFREESGTSGVELGWTNPGFDDSHWEEYLYSTGPYWLTLEGIQEDTPIIEEALSSQEKIKKNYPLNVEGNSYSWEALSFSQKMGLGRPSPWGGHSGYPDGHFDKNFIQLAEGRKLLFTRIFAPRKQTAGLNVQLRNSEVALYVNGEEQPCQGAVCNLPLDKGYNNVLLDISDGSGGMLYVQKDSPAIVDMTNGNMNTKSIYPELKDASWIWYGNTDGTYLRKSFALEELPESAQMIVTGVTGFKLFINGKKIEEEIGPWANWDYPAHINIKQYLHAGDNTIAVWGQFYDAQHYFEDLDDEYKGVALAMKAVFDDGSALHVRTDSTWKGQAEEVDNWESSQLSSADWNEVVIRGKVGDEPWGEAFLENIGSSTTPYRPLSVNLSSPYIQVFNEMPDVRYDIKPETAKKIGWYRFAVPPGIKKIKLNTEAEATAWVNGTEFPFSDNTVKIKQPPKGVANVSIRLKMEPGEYAGAAFDLPVELEMEGGKIQTGPWKNYALPTYSGMVVYKQTIHFSEEEAERSIQLDLGDVYVAAEVFVNGKSAGTRVAQPFKFNLSEFIHTGNNELEVRVANTLAPHYSNPERAMHLGATESGLIGPVSLQISPE